jgi:hypothetical protein
MGDFCRAQAADCPQRQRNRRARGKRWKAAKKQQQQQIVRIARLRQCGWLLLGGKQFAAVPGGIGAPHVSQAPRGDGEQPAAWLSGHSVGRLLLGGGDQRFLHRVSASAKPPYRRTRVARTCGASSRSRSSTMSPGAFTAPDQAGS